MNKRYLIEQAKEVSEYYRVKSHEKPGLTEAEKKAWEVGYSYRNACDLSPDFLS